MIDASRRAGEATPNRAAAPTAKVFVSDPESQEVIRSALHDLGVAEAQFVAGNVEAAIESLAREATPSLLVVDISSVDDPVARIHELANRCEPDVSVIVIGDRNDIALYRDLKNACVTEYFFKPLVPDVVKRVCANSLSGARESTILPGHSGKLIFVLGVRGGVGATTIATNAAWRLSEARQRWVMLVDLDLHNGDAALQLDAEPSHALREALESPERVDKLFLERGRIHATPRLDLLASLEPLNEFVPLREDAIHSLLETLLNRYRFVFVDVPPSVAAGIIGILRLPSICVLVSNANLASARELARWREYIGPNSPERTTVQILNMMGADGGLPESEFIRAAGKAPDITIPYDREVASASNLGVKATQKCASLKRGVGQLLRDLAGEPEETHRSILSRIFGSRTGK